MAEKSMSEVSHSRVVTTPINVAWLLTNRCNYDCGFCWRVLDHADLSLDDALLVTDRLAEAGARKISWAGGEPLLWRGIEQLIEHTSNLGIESMLITNGSRLEHVWPLGVPDYLDWLTLPLEGVGEDINVQCGRDVGHFDRTLRLLYQYRDRSVKLKINSVATKKNAWRLLEIVPLLSRLNIRRWKVFQFYPVRGFAQENEAEFILDNEEFEALRVALCKAVESDAAECELVVESTADLDRSYFTLAPDAAVYVSDHGRDVYLGNALTDDIQSVFERSELDKARYESRSRWMLPLGDNPPRP